MLDLDIDSTTWYSETISAMIYNAMEQEKIKYYMYTVIPSCTALKQRYYCMYITHVTAILYYSIRQSRYCGILS